MAIVFFLFCFCAPGLAFTAPSDGEAHDTDLESFLFFNLHSSQIYLEINPSFSSVQMERRISHISRQLTSSGVIVLYDQHQAFECPKALENEGNILCLKSPQQQHNVDEILRLTLSLKSIDGVIPAVVKLSNFDFHFLNGTQIVRTARTLFYLELNEMTSIDTKAIIDYFVSEGTNSSIFISFL